MDFSEFNLEVIPLAALSIGYLLAFINYFLGCVITSSPIPSRRIKQLGHALVQDGGTTAVVLTVFTTPLILIKLSSLLWFGEADAVYSQFYSWLGIQGGTLTGEGVMQNLISGFLLIVSIIFMFIMINVLISVIFAIISAVVGANWLVSGAVAAVGAVISGLISVYIWFQTMLYMPVLATVPITAYMLYCLYYLGEFLKRYGYVFLAIGALLYGIPLRIGRKWGAAFIAFTVVFYIGLPFMPYFVEPAASTSTAAQYIQELRGNYTSLADYQKSIGYPNVYISTHPAFGEADRCRIQMSDGSRIWRIWTDENGDRSYVLPAGSYTVTQVEYMGVNVGFEGNTRFTAVKNDFVGTAEPNIADVKLRLRVCQFKLTQTGASAPAFVDLDRCSGLKLVQFSSSGGGASIEIYSEEEAFDLAFFLTNGTTVNVKIDGSPSAYSRILSTWAGAVYSVSGSGEGYHTITVTAQKVQSAPSHEYKDEDPVAPSYMPETQPHEMPWLTYYFFAVLLLPNIYIWVVLTGIATALAVAIAGRPFW